MTDLARDLMSSAPCRANTERNSGPSRSHGDDPVGFGKADRAHGNFLSSSSATFG